MKKILLISIFIFILTSCGKNELGINIENTTNTNSSNHPESEIKTENTSNINSGTIQEKDYKIVDLTNTSKADLKCDENYENCNLFITFGDLGTFKVFNGGIDLDASFFTNGFGGKAYFNEKYNAIFVSFGIGRSGQIILTHGVKIDLASKQIEKVETTYGSDFYFKDIDTIIPKYQTASKYDQYTTQLLEGDPIFLGGNNNIKDNNLSGIDFIKNYYDLLGKSKLQEVYNMTTWTSGKKDFNTFESWYKNINKVDVVKIDDLGNNEYEIITDIFYDIENDFTQEINPISFNQGGEFLSGIELYERYILRKKIVEQDGEKKLESVKTISSYSLPRIKVTILDKNDPYVEYLSYNAPNEYIYKNLSNGNYISFGDSAPYDSAYQIIIHGKKADVSNYYQWGGFFPKTFLSLIGIKVDKDYIPGNMNEAEKNKLIDLFKKAPSDMLEKVLYR